MNKQGGFSKRLSVIQNHAPDSTCMLKTPFIKNSAHFVLNVDRFILDEDVPLYQTDEVLVEIHKYTAGPFPNEYLADHQFRGRYLTVSAFVNALQRFFANFSLVFLKYGLLNQKSISVANVVTGTPLNLSHHDKDTLQDESKPVSCRITEDGRLEIRVSPGFYDNFYIKVHPLITNALGFPKYLFFYQRHVNGVVIQYTQSTNNLFQADGVTFENTVNVRIDNIYRNAQNIATHNIAWRSDHSVQHIDRRLSLDVTATLPISNRMVATNGKETQEHLLARFWYEDIAEFDVSQKYKSDGKESEMNTKERCVVGLQSLTKGTTHSEAVFTLPGQIQLIKLGLFARYLEDDKITSNPIDIDQGMWSIGLRFDKKV